MVGKGEMLRINRSTLVEIKINRGFSNALGSFTHTRLNTNSHTHTTTHIFTEAYFMSYIYYSVAC